MDEFREDLPEKPALDPMEDYWGRVVEKKLDEDLQDLGSDEGPLPVEAQPGLLESLESTTDEDDKPAFNYGKLVGILIFIIIVVVKVPPLRVAVIILSVLVGIYFGVNWLRKGILRQEVRPFSRESGFYWLLLSLGIAFVVFLIGLLPGTYPLP